MTLTHSRRLFVVPACVLLLLASAWLLVEFGPRSFWVQALPQMAGVACGVAGLFVGWVWWRRRGDVLYGLFALAAIGWCVRILTQGVAVLPTDGLPWWRVWHFLANAGFVLLIALFVIRFIRAGERYGSTLALWAALVLTLAAAVHDHVMALDGFFQLPDTVSHWFLQGVSLLPYAGSLLIFTMLTQLTLRFEHTLDAAAANHSYLQNSVAERERELQTGHEQVARLEREQAVSGERQRIMQDLHDGLGSQMFTTLSRVERGGVDATQLAHMLRSCIADMRLTFEVIAPDSPDLATAFAAFRFRWDSLLRDAGLVTHWQVQGLAQGVALQPSTVLQLFRIAQEALTNVLKHAKASRVDVTVRIEAGMLDLAVQDNGCGMSTQASPGSVARGVSNMRHRAQQLGVPLLIESKPGCTRVTARLAVPDQPERRSGPRQTGRV